MKITLISIYPDLRSYGIRSISACLKQEGHDVDLIFLLREFTEKYTEKTMNDLVKLTKESDLVGITLMSNFWDLAVQITQKLKDNYDFPILWGGTHPTIRPEECLDYADMVAIGESEETLIELSRKMQNKQYYYDIKGMGFNDKGKKIVNGLRALPGTKNAAIIKSLDQIPFQDYDYKSHFVLKGKNIIKMDQEIMEHSKCADTYQTMPTRGCPFACTFCVNNTFLKMHPHQNPIRKRSVDNIIGELVGVKNKLPCIKIILFNDDAFFMMSVDEIKELSKRYKEEIGIPLYITGATPNTLTKEKLAPLVDAGLIEIRLGVQSAAEGAKKLYKRPHSNPHVANAVKMVNRYKDKLKASYDIILDSPWDTDEDLIETLMFLSKLPTPLQLTMYSMVFYPATDVYKKAKKEGLIKDDLNDIYRKYFLGISNTYLNKLFLLLRDYASVGIGISPIIMFILTHKVTKKLYLHKFLRNVVRALLPFFRYMGQSTRTSTRLYKNGNRIKFNGGETTYRTNALNEFDMKMDLREFHSEASFVKPSAPPPWFLRKFRKTKLMLSRAI